MPGLDERIFHLLYGQDASRPLLYTMASLTAIGTGWSLLAFLPALAFRRPRRFVSYLIGTLAATGVTVFVLKALFHRTRPYSALNVKVLYFAPPSDYSFPSGHSAGSFCFAVFCVAIVARKDAKVRGAFWLSTVALTTATAIAVSRVFLGVHYPSDILVGALIGSSLGAIGGSAYLASVRRKVVEEEAKRDAFGSPESDASIEERVE